MLSYDTQTSIQTNKRLKEISIFKIKRIKYLLKVQQEPLCQQQILYIYLYNRNLQMQSKQYYLHILITLTFFTIRAESKLCSSPYSFFTFIFIHIHNIYNNSQSIFNFYHPHSSIHIFLTNYTRQVHVCVISMLLLRSPDSAHSSQFSPTYIIRDINNECYWFRNN